MNISYDEAMVILELADSCYSEGLLGDSGKELVRRIVMQWPEIRKEARKIYTGYLDQ